MPVVSPKGKLQSLACRMGGFYNGDTRAIMYKVYGTRAVCITVSTGISVAHASVWRRNKGLRVDKTELKYLFVRRTLCAAHTKPSPQ